MVLRDFGFLLRRPRNDGNNCHGQNSGKQDSPPVDEAVYS